MVIRSALPNCLLVVSVFPAAAQFPDKFTNFQVLPKDIAKPDLEQTNDLRGRYYGTGQYDFGETQLNRLTQDLLARSKNREAVTVMELNFKANHPDSVWSFRMLAMAPQANGQLKEAVTDLARRGF